MCVGKCEKCENAFIWHALIKAFIRALEDFPSLIRCRWQVSCSGSWLHRTQSPATALTSAPLDIYVFLSSPTLEATEVKRIEMWLPVTVVAGVVVGVAVTVHAQTAPQGPIYQKSTAAEMRKGIKNGGNKIRAYSHVTKDKHKKNHSKINKKWEKKKNAEWSRVWLAKTFMLATFKHGSEADKNANETTKGAGRETGWKRRENG